MAVYPFELIVLFTFYASLVIKVIGGGLAKKYWFFSFYVLFSKFILLSSPFYRIQNFFTVGPKYPDMLGRVQGAFFTLSPDKSDKNTKMMGFVNL